MIEARLHPRLPPVGKPAFCFYPMSKRRNVGQNWFSLPYDERLELMHGHGKTGRTFAGRVLQLITGSTGLDDYEWGVTLFAVHPDDLKDVVYTMRFDEASAIYAEFGRFFVGMVCPIDELVDRLGLTRPPLGGVTVRPGSGVRSCPCRQGCRRTRRTWPCSGRRSR
jgi:chlorite dismutase